MVRTSGWASLGQCDKFRDSVKRRPKEFIRDRRVYETTTKNEKLKLIQIKHTRKHNEIQPRNSESGWASSQLKVFTWHTTNICVQSRGAHICEKDRRASLAAHTYIVAHRLHFSYVFFLLIIISASHSLDQSFTRSTFISSTQKKHRVSQRDRGGWYSIKFFCISTGKHDRHSNEKKYAKANAEPKKCTLTRSSTSMYVSNE